MASIMDNDERTKREAFIANIACTGSHVIKILLLEAIGLVEDVDKNIALTEQLEKALPDAPIGARNVMINNKTYYIVFKPCTNVKKYNPNVECNKLKRIAPPEKHEYLKNEFDLTFSIIPYLYTKFMEDNKDFCNSLIDALPENRKKNIKTNLIEHTTSTVSMFDDRTRYALYVEKA